MYFCFDGLNVKVDISTCFIPIYCLLSSNYNTSCIMDIIVTLLVYFLESVVLW